MIDSILALVRVGAILGAAWAMFHVGELAERGRWNAAKADAITASAAVDHAWSERFIAAQDRNAARDAAREPIVLRSTNTVREYAQTADGRVLCLPAERVRGIEADAAALSAAAQAAGNGNPAMPADAAHPAGGRLDVPR